MSLSYLFKRLLSSDIKEQIEAEYLTSEGKFTDAGQRTLLQGFYEGATNGSEYLTARAKELNAKRREDEAKTK